MWLAFGFPYFLQFANVLHHLQCRVAGLCGVADFFEGRAPEGHDGIADVLVERTLVIKDQTGHVRKILVQEKRQVLRVEFFGNRGKAANVAEHHGDFGLLWLDELRIHQQAADDFRAEILAERRAHAALLFFLEE